MVSIISRSQWGARRSQGPVYDVSWSSRTGFVVHHSGADEDQTVKEIQNYHMDKNGWADIGYNFLIDKTGRIFEGRGWSKVGAHVHGHNTANIGVCVIGDYSNKVPSSAVHAALDWLYAEANRRKGAKLKVYGHRQLGSTACPGTQFYNVLKAWLSDTTPPSNPKPPTSPNQGWTEKLMNELPELSEGSAGLYVNRHQALLNIAGAGLREDGKFGPVTKRKTREFQTKHGLVPDGIVGPKTWSKELTWK